MILILVLNLTTLVMCSSTITKFAIMENQEPASKSIIDSLMAWSIINCAHLCSSKSTKCKSFLFASSSLECTLMETVIVNESELTGSSLIYAQLSTAQISTATTSSSTLAPTSITTTSSSGPTTSTSSLPVTVNIQPHVIDIVYGANLMCLDMSNSVQNDDLIVLTIDGVYIYDDISQLSVAPCNGPLAFLDVFKGFPTMPSSPGNVRGLSLYQTNEIELFADDNKVYRWRGNVGELDPLTSGAYNTIIATNDLDGVDFLWCALWLGGGNVLRYFYLGNQDFYLATTLQVPTNTFKQHETVLYNGVDFNIWKMMPPNIIAAEVTGDHNNPDIVLIDQSGTVYIGSTDVPFTSVGPLGTS